MMNLSSLSKAIGLTRIAGLIVAGVLVDAVLKQDVTVITGGDDHPACLGG